MTIATCADGITPRSGWHYVCPCGWTVLAPSQPPTERVARHHRNHRMAILTTTRSRFSDAPEVSS